jgi:uncharacterized membrane protein YqhA
MGFDTNMKYNVYATVHSFKMGIVLWVLILTGYTSFIQQFIPSEWG